MNLILGLFITFFEIGCLSFGGGISAIALIGDEIQKFGVIGNETFANMVAISQATPGPIAINIATFVGESSSGIIGALAATIGVALPSFAIMCIIYRLVGTRLDNKYLQGTLSCVKSAVVAMMLYALWMIAEPTILAVNHIGGMASGLTIDPIACGMVIATVLLVGKFKQKPIVTMLIMGCIGMAFSI